MSTKKTTSLAIDSDLLDRVDSWRVGKSVWLSRNQVFALAIEEFLKNHKRKFYDPFYDYQEEIK